MDCYYFQIANLLLKNNLKVWFPAFGEVSLILTGSEKYEKITLKFIEENMGTQAKVVVFSTPACSWCRTLKQYLKKQNIRFKDIDVSRDQAAAKDMLRRTGQQGVPVTLINNRAIVGFNKSEINRLLNIKGG